MGAIVVPLFTLFGADGLAYRLADSGCRALVTDHANLAKVATIREGLSDLSTILCTDGPEECAEGWEAALAPASDRFETVPSGPADPVLISYTSGTTGPPKGALHGHRVLAAHVEGARLVYDMERHAGGMFWTPADWAWMGGSMNAMGPALVHGVPLLAHRMAKFDPERAFDLMARMDVTAAFLPPTALKLMRRVENPDRFGVRLRAVGSAGEAMGAEALAWGREAFRLTINEFYGQTECNMVIGNAAHVLPPKPGAMGLPMPGHDVAVLGPDLRPLRPGLTGELAIRAPDPGQFLGYWGLPEKTAEKLRVDATGAGWLLTGDEAVMDGEGWLTFSSRADDVITSSGYRVGPTEIEECLAGHPSVAIAAVVGAPDPVRTETIRAFVTLSPGAEAGDRLAAALVAHVKTRLSPHLAPANIEFIEEIPVTATGKIMRRELRARLIAQDTRETGGAA